MLGSISPDPGRNAVLHHHTTVLPIRNPIYSGQRIAAQIVTAITEILIRPDPFMRRSVTFDNGTECAKHSALKEAPGIATFFCHA